MRGARPNPLRELIAEKQRNAGSGNSVERSHGELPAIISRQVDQQLERLESKLVQEFRRFGERTVEQGAHTLTEDLSSRIETLEQISALQSRSIVNLRDISKVAEQKVGTVVNTIERALTETVPEGLQLAPTEPEHPEVAEAISARHVCPKCTSTNVRRAYRDGILEECLRLFFIAPFRCRACRNRFYWF